MITRNPIVDPNAGRPLVDEVPQGGIKGLTTETVNISPFVSESLSAVSWEESRISSEKQFRQLADVTRALVIEIKKLQQNLELALERIAKLESEIPDPPPPT